MSAAEQLVDEVQELAPAASAPRVIRLLGRDLVRFDATSSWFHGDPALAEPTMQLTCHGDERWRLRIDRYGVEVVVEDESPEATAPAWLELASLEAPRLCALVVDGMAVTP